MKVLIEAEVVESHEGGKMFVVRLDTGFGGQTVPVSADKAHKLEGPSPLLGMMAMKTALEAAEHDLTTHGGLIASDKKEGISAGTPIYVLETKGTLTKIRNALKLAGFRK